MFNISRKEKNGVIRTKYNETSESIVRVFIW